MQWQTPLDWPDWDHGREQRLLVSMLFATLLVLAGMSLLRLPLVPDFSPIVELLVQIVREPPADDIVEESPTVPVTESIDVPPLEAPQKQVETQGDPFVEDAAAAESAEPASAAAPLPSIDADASDTPAVDLATASEAAVSDFLDELENPPSVNPVQDAKRKAFEGKYQPPTHPGPRPIWENVETDQLGRTVLRSGDCFKVLADPNVGSQYKFEHFDQYMTTCVYQKRLPRELPWVSEIRDRYQYLKYPDGIVPEEERAEGQAAE